MFLASTGSSVYVKIMSSPAKPNLTAPLLVPKPPCVGIDPSPTPTTSKEKSWGERCVCPLARRADHRHRRTFPGNTASTTMIAAIEWIPAGRANPTPSKYEYSRAEQEFLARVQAGDLGGVAEDDDDDEAADDDGAANGSDEDWEDMEEEEGGGSGGKKTELPKVDPNSLPADLRMDEYSDDDDDREKNVGGLLVGKVRLKSMYVW